MSQKKTIPIFDASENAEEELSACSSGEPYALMVLGDSMLPEFEDGEIIVIEPEGLAKDGSYVVAYHNDEYTFRQLLVRDGKHYLQALNDLYPTEEIAGIDAVKGVVIQKKKPGKRSSFKSYV
jgi:DNA polymerase V